MVDAEPMSIAIESDTRFCKAPTPRNAAVFRMNAIAEHDNAYLVNPVNPEILSND